MPPKSDYWKYFVVQGVLAICQLQGCPKPNGSLGALPKPGQKKRISEYILYITAAHYQNAFFQHLGQSPHQPEWDAYLPHLLHLSVPFGNSLVYGINTADFSAYMLNYQHCCF